MVLYDIWFSCWLNLYHTHCGSLCGVYILITTSTTAKIRIISPKSLTSTYECLIACVVCLSCVRMVHALHLLYASVCDGCWKARCRAVDIPVELEVELRRLPMTTLSLFCRLSRPTSTTWVCSRGAHHFIVYLGPTGTKLLMSGGPLVEKHIIKCLLLSSYSV